MPSSFISIHPPRVGRDLSYTLSMTSLTRDFNPPSPCGEGHRWQGWQTYRYFHFNPPSPCGEGLGLVDLRRFVAEFQSTLPVWGGTQPGSHAERRTRISIHPPRVGRDPAAAGRAVSTMSFQSTLPVWGGTVGGRVLFGPVDNFNPPSPCGEGPARSTSSMGVSVFQSTLPVWGGTDSDTVSATAKAISIHPPRVGRDGRRYSISP